MNAQDKYEQRLLLQLGELAMAHRDWPNAVERWRAAWANDRENSPPRLFAQLSVALRNQALFEEAESVAGEGRSRFPESMELAIEHAELALARSDWAEATTRWQSAAKLCGKRVPAAIRIGAAVANRFLGQPPATSFGQCPPNLPVAKAEALNGIHKGRTVYILGAGPSLLNLTKTQIKRLACLPTIGVNRVQYRVPLAYFLSAYPCEVFLAQRACPTAQPFHMRAAYAPPIMEGVIPLKREVYKEGDDLPHGIQGPEPSIITRSNVIFGAISLAAVMAPARIVFYGVEQRNRMHFYNSDPSPKYRIFQDLVEVHNTHGHLFSADHKYSTLYKLIEELFLPAPQLAAEPFYHKMDHTDLLREFMRLLRARGIQPVSAVKDSVLVDAGADFEPLEFE